MAHRVVCDGCGWEVEVTEGAYIKRLDTEASAKKRRAGHIGNGCAPEEVRVEAADG